MIQTQKQTLPQKPPVRHRPLFPAFLLAGLLVLLLAAAPELAAQGRGQLFGRVITRSDTGEPLALPGASLVLTSRVDTSNRFVTGSDAGGSYSILDVPPGLYILTVSLTGYADVKQNVAVEPSTVQEINLEMKIEVVREQVTVTAEGEGIQIDQTSPREQLSGELYDTAALASERFLDALPLVPGVVRGPDGLMRIKGMRSSQTGWLVNSANITDPATGEQALNLPVDVVQEVVVLPNPFSAEYGKFAGAVTTVETKSPSDHWKFKLNNFLPRTRKRNGKIRGIESATPRLTVAGPLYKDKVFLLQSVEYRLSRNPVTSLPELERDTDIESLDTFTQFDLNFNALHKATVVFSAYPQKNRFATLDTFNPQPVTANYRQKGWMGGLRDRYLFRNGSLLETTLSVKDFDASIFPATPRAVFLLQPEENGGSFFNRQNRISRRYEWLEMYSLAPRQARGQHWLKIGVNIARDIFRGTNQSNTVQVLRADGTLSEQIDFTGSPLVERDKTEITFFLQDKWNVHRRLTLDLGLRYDRDTLARENNFAPRVGFALVLTGDNRTVLRGGGGLFYDKIPLNIGVFEQYQQRVVSLFGTDGLTLLGAPRTYVNRLTNLENPRSVAFSVELDREIRRGLLLRIGYLQREGRDEYLIEPFDDLDGVPALELAARGRSRYRELQFTANFSFREGSFLNVSYVRSRAEGDLNAFSEFFGNYWNPVLRANERSRLRHDTPNRVVAWGDLELLWGVHWSPALEVRSGFPFSRVDEERNFVGRRNRDNRFPVWQTLDSQVYKRFKVKVFGKKRTIMVGLKMFNILAHFNPRDVQQNIDASNALGFFNSRGRLYRGKFTIEF